MNNTKSSGFADLCDPTAIKISYSSYFIQANHKNTTCSRKRLSSYTDEFTLSIKLDELSLANPSDANIYIKIKSEYNRVVHYFKYQFKSYWSGTIDDDSSSFSMLSGTMVPHILYNDNTNISAAFRGPDPNIISVELTPTYYFDEINSLNYSGYRVYHRFSQRGSVVNERTLMNPTTYDGKSSEDFSVKFQTTLSSEVYNVRVLRLKTLIDIMAQIMGLLAGMAFLSRFAKFLLMKCNIWVHLDR